MSTMRVTVFVLAAFVLGLLANGHIPAANAQAGDPAAGKSYQYKIAQCGGGSINAAESCMNSLGREGWRAVAPFGSAFIIFEK